MVRLTMPQERSPLRQIHISVWKHGHAAQALDLASTDQLVGQVTIELQDADRRDRFVVPAALSPDGFD